MLEQWFQLIIPGGLSPERYISGFPALNLPSPEGTSGNWHFGGAFYRKKKDAGTIFLAGEGVTAPLRQPKKYLVQPLIIPLSDQHRSLRSLVVCLSRAGLPFHYTPVGFVELSYH